MTKRLVCFDLFDTLIETTLPDNGSYSSYLRAETGKNAAEVSALVRNLFMRTDRPEAPPRLPFFTRQSDYKTMSDELTRRLLPAPPWVNRRTAVASGVAERWEAENQTIRWIKGAPETIANLRANGSTLCLATNISAIGWQETLRRLPKLAELFDDYTVSCFAIAAKPDPYIWERLMSTYNDIDEYWMIGDDLILDLTVSKALGWKTILVGKNGVSISEVPNIISKGG